MPSGTRASNTRLPARQSRNERTLDDSSEEEDATSAIGLATAFLDMKCGLWLRCGSEGFRDIVMLRRYGKGGVGVGLSQMMGGGGGRRRGYNAAINLLNNQNQNTVKFFTVHGLCQRRYYIYSSTEPTCEYTACKGPGVWRVAVVALPANNSSRRTVKRGESPPRPSPGT